MRCKPWLQLCSISVLLKLYPIEKLFLPENSELYYFYTFFIYVLCKCEKNIFFVRGCVYAEQLLTKLSPNISAYGILEIAENSQTAQRSCIQIML